MLAICRHARTLAVVRAVFAVANEVTPAIPEPGAHDQARRLLPHGVC